MVKTGEWFSRGLALVMKDIWIWVVITLIMMVVNSTGIGQLLQGPLFCSAFYMMIRKIRSDSGPDFGDLAKGFDVFVQALLAWLISCILISIGTMICLIPGIVLGVGYLFIYPLVIDKGMDFWTAMETSRQKVFEDFFGFLVFGLACFGVALLGALCLGVGVLVAVPVIWAATAYAYEDLFGGAPAAPAPQSTV